MTADNTTDSGVDRVFASLDRMDDFDLVALGGVWMGLDAEVRGQAWSKVRSVPRDDTRAKSLEQGRDRLAGWVNDLGITWAGAYERSIVVPAGVDQGNLRRNAVPAILDAIVAVLFEDVLTAEEREVLVEPLRHVTEEKVADD